MPAPSVSEPVTLQTVSRYDRSCVLPYRPIAQNGSRGGCARNGRLLRHECPRYTQSTGKAGLSSSGSSDLWLENNAGVIMHLQGTSSGAMLTLGKDEIIIRMAQ